MREAKDHPLVKEIEGVVTAIEQCPASPEKDTALMKANRAQDYAVTVITNYEERHQGIMDTVMVDTLPPESFFKKILDSARLHKKRK